MSGKKDIEINLKPFNMKKVPRESIIVLLGKRNTGKSVLVKDILYHKRDIPVGTVISHTDNLTHFYAQIVMNCEARCLKQFVRSAYKKYKYFTANVL